MLINLFKDQLVAFTADGFVTVFAITKHDTHSVDLLRIDTYDIRGLCVHPACIISVTLPNLKNDSTTRASQGEIILILNQLSSIQLLSGTSIIRYCFFLIYRKYFTYRNVGA